MSIRAWLLTVCACSLLSGCIVVHEDDHPPAPEEPATAPEEPTEPVEPAPAPKPVEPAPPPKPEPRSCPGCKRKILDTSINECPDCETDLTTGKRPTKPAPAPEPPPVEPEPEPPPPPPVVEPAPEPKPAPKPKPTGPKACPACGEQVLDSKAKECPSCETPLGK